MPLACFCCFIFISSLSVSKNVTVDNSPYKMPAEEATAIVNHVSYFSSCIIFVYNFKLKHNFSAWPLRRKDYFEERTRVRFRVR